MTTEPEDRPSDGRAVRLYLNQTWTNFWTTQTSFSWSPRTVSTRLARGGPRMQTPRAWTASLQLRNRAASETSWSADLAVSGDEDGGFSHELSGGLAIRPGPRWQLSIDPSLQRQVNTQQYVTALEGGREEVYGKRYVFATIDRSTYVLQLRLTYTFKPDVTLDVYAEPFAASGRYYDVGELELPATRLRRTYGEAPGTTATRNADGSLVVTDGGASFRLDNEDFRTRSFRSNVVLRWEYRPGSTLYLVWQQDRQESEPFGNRVGLGDPFRSLTAPGNNYFVVKASYWLPVG